MPLSFLFACSAGWLFPCLPRGLFPCLLPDGSSLQRPCRQHLRRSGAPDRQRLPDGASLPADCLPCRSLLPYPLPTVFHGAPAGSISATAAPLTGSVFPMALCHSAAILFAMALPASSPAMALPASSSATAPLPAVLCADGPLPATASPQRLCRQHLPDGSSLQRPCQQQTSSGGEKYSGLASNLAHLGRIC